MGFIQEFPFLLKVSRGGEAWSFLSERVLVEELLHGERLGDGSFMWDPSPPVPL